MDSISALHKGHLGRKGRESQSGGSYRENRQGLDGERMKNLGPAQGALRGWGEGSMKERCSEGRPTGSRSCTMGSKGEKGEGRRRDVSRGKTDEV